MVRGAKILLVNFLPSDPGAYEAGEPAPQYFIRGGGRDSFWPKTIIGFIKIIKKYNLVPRLFPY